MLYLIESQKSRNINEIMYDHNTENLSDSKQALHYRKDEIIMKTRLQ